MTTRRIRWLRFTLRGLLLLTLCTACYFGGWSAHRRVYEREQQAAAAAARKAEASAAKRIQAALLAMERAQTIQTASTFSTIVCTFGDPPPKKKVEGELLAVDELGYVEVSLGYADGLEREDTLEVYRLGATSQASKYLGRVRIIRALEDRSIAQVIPELMKGEMKPGDRVANRLQ